MPYIDGLGDVRYKDMILISIVEIFYELAVVMDAMRGYLLPARVYDCLGGGQIAREVSDAS
jgi:hypothetical protein